MKDMSLVEKLTVAEAGCSWRDEVILHLEARVGDLRSQAELQGDLIRWFQGQPKGHADRQTEDLEKIELRSRLADAFAQIEFLQDQLASSNEQLRQCLGGLRKIIDHMPEGAFQTRDGVQSLENEPNQEQSEGVLRPESL
jgi:hypothetical protein